jgi:hypothetical protein
MMGGRSRVAFGVEDFQDLVRLLEQHPEWRAQLLGRLRPTLPVVAGEWTTAEAQAQATAGGVWRVVDGRVLAPGGG